MASTKRPGKTDPVRSHTRSSKINQNKHATKSGRSAHTGRRMASQSELGQESAPRKTGMGPLGSVKVWSEERVIAPGGAAAAWLLARL